MKDYLVCGKDEIRGYLYHLMEERHLSSTSCNQAYYALKFFYERILKQDWASFSIPHAKRERRLPVVLSIKEVHRLLEAVDSLKYQVGTHVDLFCWPSPV